MVTRRGEREFEYNVPPKSLQIKEEDKFFSRLLSKETSNSKAESSFRVLYYGGASGAVPFVWESRPGTPKHPFSDTSLPPLTPPPSYQTSPVLINSLHKQYSKPRFLKSIFPLKNTSKKSSNSAKSFSTSSYSSSSSYSLPSTPMNSFNSRRKCVRRSRSAVHFGLQDDEDLEDEQSFSPTSTLCFGGRNRSSVGKIRSYYGMKNVKKAIMSIVGHGHGSSSTTSA
ncbi:hypothetical protein M9H77_10767 [Catharanthus roseus]|uniref:Uncharacterized protein n=1 Tax=Catharanthus roseus TaxID=4058 RepID=A0ACC0BCW4_CATRO|nr:hypothetical protein M9H77_10767 [Catharanthus roseus]